MAKKNAPEETTVVTLDGYIGWWESDARWLKNQLKNKKNILLKINSAGGSIFDANEMFNVLREHEYTVNTEMGALAASAAGYLFLGGDNRSVHKNSTWMAHRAYGGMWGTADDMLEEAEILQGLEGIIAMTIADATGKDKDDVLNEMKDTKWLFGGENIVESGVADNIMDADDENEADDSIDEASNRLQARNAMETTRQKFAEDAENARHGINKFSNFLKTSKNEIPPGEETQTETTITPSNGEIPMTEEQKIAAQNEGVAMEKDRVNAWLKFNDIDPDYVQKGIESGKEMNSTDMAHLNRKMMDKNAAQNLTNENPDPVTPEPVEVKPENSESGYTEDEQNWLKKYEQGGE